MIDKLKEYKPEEIDNVIDKKLSAPATESPKPTLISAETQKSKIEIQKEQENMKLLKLIVKKYRGEIKILLQEREKIEIELKNQLNPKEKERLIKLFQENTESLQEMLAKVGKYQQYLAQISERLFELEKLFEK